MINVKNWEEFQILVKKFDDETSGHSVIGPRYRNEHFKKMLEFPNIIELFINDFLYCGAAHWHYKLVELTGEDPVKNENYGRMEKIRQTWLEWAYKKEIITDERKLRNLRSEEAIELTSLIFPWHDKIVSKMNFSFSGGYLDNPERISVSFKAEIFKGTKEVKVQLDPCFDFVSRYMVEDFFDVNSPAYMKYYLWDDIPIKNQRKAQMKLLEWGYIPDEIVDNTFKLYNE